MNIRLLTVACAGAALMMGTAAQAATITWTQWAPGSTSPASGTAGAVGVTYTGDLVNVDFSSASWNPTSTFADGTIVANAPLQTEGMIHVVGGDETVNTITFSQAVVDPVFSIWSLGQGGIDARFDFSSAFNLVAGGPSAEYTGQSIGVDGNDVTGVEGNGTIQFNGVFKSISFTNPVNENYYGFTVGYAAVASGAPEPASWALMLLGFGGLGATLRQARRRQAVTATA